MRNAIALTDVTKRFGRVTALRSVSLTVPEGSVTALLGLNGAGKSTLLRTLVGLLTPDEGRGSVLGYPLGPQFPPVEMKGRIAFVPARPALWGQMTAAELIRFIAPFYPRWEGETVNRYLKTLGLPTDRRVATFSTGMRSQLSLLLAMGANPDLFLLDEPTQGLDPYHRRQYLQLLLGDAIEKGRTVFLSTHDIHQIELLADRVVILDQGRVICESPLDELKEGTKRYRIGLAPGAPAPDRQALPGFIRATSEGRHLLLTAHGEPSRIREALLQLPGVEAVGIYDLSLEEIFLSYVAPA
jgi:ABC-2 type transport system ATP-binding protein